MRICYLADINSSHTEKWCNFFKAKGYDIHVISLTYGKIEGITVHSLDLDLKKVQSNNILYKFKYLFQIARVKRLVRQINPDILHSHYASSYGLLGALTNFHPFIISIWGSDVYEFPTYGIIPKSILKYNLSKSDKILSTSKDMAIEARKYINRDMEITPFGVNIDFFRPYKKKDINNNQFTIGIVKSLEEKYGIKYLIRAFAVLRKKYSHLKLEIVGDGSQKDYLKELCTELNVLEDVTFFGSIPPSEVVKAFNRFDVAVFPSLAESFGVAAVEAQACGVPVVVSNVGGFPEATCPGKSSLLVKKCDVKGIVEQVEKLIVNEELRNDMGMYGRKFVEKNYNINDNFNKVDSIYKQLLNK